MTHQNLDGISDGERLDTIDFAGHFFYRLPSNGLVGVIGQHSSELVSEEGYWSNLTGQWYAGVEGLGYWNNFSLYGQIAATSATDDGDTATGVTGAVRARYFFSPQFLIEGKAAFEHISLNSDTVDASELSAALEYQCATLPISVFARYSHFSQRFSYNSLTSSADRILVGAKWNFGGKSLWERETGGAALDPLAPLQFLVQSPTR